MYKAPILFLSPDGIHTAFPDTEAVSKFLKAYLAAQAKSGRTGTEIEKFRSAYFRKALLWLSSTMLLSVPTEIRKLAGFIFPEGSGHMACGIIGAPRRVNYRGSRRVTMSVRFARVGSTGRCNTGVKSLRWGFECQSPTWPLPVTITIGIVAVAALAASTEGSPPVATMIATWLRTSSAASTGRRSY